ncbi:chlorite dismutase family protein [Sphingomonas sp. 28-63-12]|uniref:chlorite dismutase family protein n=1 Tax=Sphingomonas sp. 28-63-12 TaxID=1970434 RepID=UPI000BD814D7|nr:MAG: chlorite dismutase [Sphingomonas sp. 28-63-12]
MSSADTDGAAPRFTPLPITHFTGGDDGQWRVISVSAVCGDSLPPVAALAIDRAGAGGWRLRGTASHLRYTTASERTQLRARQEGLGRPASTRAALLPIRKSAAWWEMAQDDRRAVYVRGSHLPIGMDYLPGVARKLYHSRDLGEDFDFLTWFEFAPDQEAAFDQMLARLRGCAEWAYVDREVDIRLIRA